MIFNTDSIKYRKKIQTNFKKFLNPKKNQNIPKIQKNAKLKKKYKKNAKKTTKKQI